LLVAPTTFFLFFLVPRRKFFPANWKKAFLLLQRTMISRFMPIPPLCLCRTFSKKVPFFNEVCFFFFFLGRREYGSSRESPLRFFILSFPKRNFLFRPAQTFLRGLFRFYLGKPAFLFPAFFFSWTYDTAIDFSGSRWFF